MVPKKLFFTKGVGKHREKLESFEFALRNAGIEKFNLVRVSSILPPDCKIVSPEKGLKELETGQIVYCVLSQSQSNEPRRLLATSIGCAIPADRKNYGYLSEHHSFGESDAKAGAYAEDLAASMLASTLGIDLDLNKSWDERKEVWKVSGKIVRTRNTTQSAIVPSLFKFMILDNEKEKKLLDDYSKSKERLILLDYDGTLVPFFDRPEDARPSDDVLEVLKKLAEDEKNEVVLISGRSRKNVDDWFDIEVRPVLEKYVESTPGSFTEEKDFSLAWHFRAVSPELSLTKPRELVDNLKFIHSMNLQMMEVNQVIEVMNAGVDKSTATLKWLEKKDWDFIMALGDDWTDEDTFSVLPKTAYTIKVGPRPSQARFSLDSYPLVLWLLKKLAKN
jgi:arginine decarboxylase